MAGASVSPSEGGIDRPTAGDDGRMRTRHRDVLPSLRGARGVDALLRVIYGTTRAPLGAAGKSVVHVAAAWERDDRSLVRCLLTSAHLASSARPAISLHRSPPRTR